MRNHRRLSDSEREARREQDRRRLEQATEQLLSSEGWQRWVHVRSRNGLSRYSVNNQLLIALARPDASYVCGFRCWLQLGYQVRKGEKAIWIFAPMPIDNRDATAAQDIDSSDSEKPRVLFRAVPVFDRAQVDPVDGVAPARLDPPSEPLTGDSHRHLIDPLLTFAQTLGYSVSFQEIAGGTGGWCDHAGKRIAVDTGQPINGQVRILVHELGHALGVGYQEYGRRKAEVIVDTTIFSPCQALSAESVGSSVGNGVTHAFRELRRLQRAWALAAHLDGGPRIDRAVFLFGGDEPLPPSWERELGLEPRLE